MRPIAVLLLLSGFVAGMTPDELNRLGTARQRNGNLRGASESWLAALDGLTVQDHALHASILNNLGALAYQQERYSDAVRYLTAARSEWALADHPDVIESTSTAVNLAAVYRTQFRFREAEALYQEAIDRRSTGLIGPLTGLASLDREDGRPAQAEELSRRALRIAESSGAIATETITVLGTLAAALADQEKQAEAEQVARRAQALAQPGSAQLADTLNTLGWIHKRRGNLAAAEADYRKGAAILSRVSGAPVATLAAMENNLADVLIARRHDGEARVLLEKAIAGWRKTLGSGHPWEAPALVNLGVLESKQHHYREAEARLLEAVGIYRGYPARPEQLGLALSNLAAVYARSRDLARADGAYREAIELLRKAWEPNDPRLEPVLTGYAAVCRERQQYSEAERLDSQALGIRVRQAIEKERASRS